jgi:hypothetical protein
MNTPQLDHLPNRLAAEQCDRIRDPVIKQLIAEFQAICYEEMRATTPEGLRCMTPQIGQEKMERIALKIQERMKRRVVLGCESEIAARRKMRDEERRKKDADKVAKDAAARAKAEVKELVGI